MSERNPKLDGADAALFAAEMANVRPLADNSKKIPPSRPRIRRVPRNELAEGQRYLQALIDGDVEFDLASSDEYIEGAAKGLDRKLVRKLKNGEYAVNAHLDLHGMVRNEAQDAVLRFIGHCQKHGHRCALIIHGRGLNSKEQIPVLKESVQLWLTRGRVSREVLAFCSARPADGGLGAVYVLLRKSR